MQWIVEAAIMMLILGTIAEFLGKKYPEMSIGVLVFVVLVATAISYNGLKILCSI